jgi:hypothetical protein
VVEPSTKQSRVQIERGRDIVQPPSLWYQEGSKPPDSLGILRIPYNTGEPDVITYPDADGSFPVNLQVATFVRNGQIAELPLSSDVVQGVTSGRIIIRSPAEDFYDIAVPYGVDPIKQVPGDETIIDAGDWYRASLRNPNTGEEAPSDQFHTIRELRGQLRSTASGGESVYFVIVAGRVERPLFTISPMMGERVLIPEARSTINIRVETVAVPKVDLTTSVALLAGPNRANIPGRFGNYSALRLRGAVSSTLRWYASEAESYEITAFGMSQPTFSDEDGSHHDVPYGAALAARFGSTRALELRIEASYEDDPFQAQSFTDGDERLRLTMGHDYETPEVHRRLSIGPTYFRDKTSLWENDRRDARELGFTIDGLWDEQVQVGPFTTTAASSVTYNHSWGYIRDRGTRNITLEGHLALKPNLQFGSARFAIGPALYVQYVSNEYATIQGFSEFNIQGGVELTSRIRY